MLTRIQVARRLGRSIATVRRLECVLHPVRDEGGVYRFNAGKVDRVVGDRRRGVFAAGDDDGFVDGWKLAGEDKPDELVVLRDDSAGWDWNEADVASPTVLGARVRTQEGDVAELRAREAIERRTLASEIQTSK